MPIFPYKPVTQQCVQTAQKIKVGAKPFTRIPVGVFVEDGSVVAEAVVEDMMWKEQIF